MISLNLAVALIFLLVFVTISFVMIVFENKNVKMMCFWLVIFLFTNIFGFIAYVITSFLKLKESRKLHKKIEEDYIYSNLIKHSMNHSFLQTDDNLFAYIKNLYQTRPTKNNKIDIFTTFADFEQAICMALNEAKKYVILDISKVDKQSFENVLLMLQDCAKRGVSVRCIFSNRVSKTIISTLRDTKIKVNKFPHTFYRNLKNTATIDGTQIFIGRFENNSNGKQVVSNYFHIQGDVAQQIDLDIRQDALFASGKHIDLKKGKEEELSNNTKIHYLSTNIDANIDEFLIKMFLTARKQIQLQLESFTPSDSVLSILKFAQKSGVEVDLMLPKLSKDRSICYASRAFAKELATLGANVYLFDGEITSNIVVIDYKYAILGGFSLNQSEQKCLQNAMLVIDDQTIKSLTKNFTQSESESYKVSNGKLMLFKEKFFKRII